jgi:hypothetical protein
MEHLLFLLHAFLLHGQKIGQKDHSHFYKWRGVGNRGEPDDCHVNGGEVHGLGVLILEVSATCSWEEKVIPFLCKSGLSGIEDCIAPPVEGEEMGFCDLDLGFSGELCGL